VAKCTSITPQKLIIFISPQRWQEYLRKHVAWNVVNTISNGILKCILLVIYIFFGCNFFFWVITQYSWYLPTKLWMYILPYSSGYAVILQSNWSQIWSRCNYNRIYIYIYIYIWCPTRYRPRHFFNNSNINEDITNKFEQEYVPCVRNEEECVCSVCL